MSPDVVELIAPVLALTGVGAMVLIGMKMRYTHLQRTRHGGGGEDVARLTENVETLREEVRMLRGEYLELHERVDFAERVLTRGNPPDAKS